LRDLITGGGETITFCLGRRRDPGPPAMRCTESPTYAGPNVRPRGGPLQWPRQLQVPGGTVAGTPRDLLSRPGGWGLCREPLSGSATGRTARHSAPLHCTGPWAAFGVAWRCMAPWHCVRSARSEEWLRDSHLGLCGVTAAYFELLAPLPRRHAYAERRPTRVRRYHPGASCAWRHAPATLQAASSTSALRGRPPVWHPLAIDLRGIGKTSST
jgi:hypothetical protein